MYLRSLISTSKVAGEGTNKPITYFTLPLKDKENFQKDSLRMLNKIKWGDSEDNAQNLEKLVKAVDDFIDKYATLGKRHIPIATALIASIHNLKQLAHLTFKPKEQNETRKKAIQEARQTELANMLLFINDCPIEKGKDYIEKIGDGKYTLNVDKFIEKLKEYKIYESTSKLFIRDLRKYQASKDKPLKDALKHVLNAYENNTEIEAYNSALKQLMEQGTIGKEESLADFANSQVTRRPITITWTLVKEKLNECLSSKSSDDTAEQLQTKGEFNSGLTKESEIEIIKSCINNIIEYLSKSQYDECKESIKKAIILSKDFYDLLIKYIDDQKKEKLSLSEQWKAFCEGIESMPKTRTSLIAKFKDCLRNKAFEGLNNAFELLGEVFGKTGETRETKLKEAKEQIPVEIKAGSEKIGKEEIEKIFDEITKEETGFSASGTGGRLPFAIGGKPKSPVPTGTIAEAMNRDEAGSADNAQTK